MNQYYSIVMQVSARFVDKLDPLFEANTDQRAMFKAHLEGLSRHLELVALALRAIERVDSGDTAKEEALDEFMARMIENVYCTVASVTEHRLRDDTLTTEHDGIKAECICGWVSRGHFSSAAASALFSIHKEAAPKA